MKKLFVIGMAALLLVAFTMPAMAKVKIGGIAFTDFYYIDRNAENSHARGFGPNSFTHTALQVPNITRLYARWTNEDNVGLYIELGLGLDGGTSHEFSPEDSGSARVRFAYGWWDISPSFQIMAGKSSTPFSPLNPSQLIGTRSGSVNIIGVGYGDYYAGRFAQVRGTFKFGKVARLAVALVDPNGALSAGGSYGPWGTLGTDYQSNTKIPRIDIGVPIYLGPISIYPGLMYQHRTVDLVNPASAGVNNDVDTIIGSLGVKGGFGPFGFSAEVNYGQNWGNSRGLAGASPPVGISSAIITTVGGSSEINDADTYSFWVDLNYKFGPITPHVMFGQMKTNNKTSWGAKTEAKSSMVGFSVPIDLAKGFRIRPEVMWYDDGDVKTDGLASSPKGKYMIAGVQFQITF